MGWSKEDDAFVWDRIIRPKGGFPTGAARKKLKSDVRARFPAPSEAEIKRWNSGKGASEMDATAMYARRNGMPEGHAGRILQAGWQNSKEQLSLKGLSSVEKTMARKRGTRGLGLFARSRKAALRRAWTSVSSGKVPMVKVPKACALVQSGEKAGKLRRGCRLTKNGAYCEELAKLPVEAKIGPKYKGKSKDGKRRVWKRRTVQCT